MIDVDCYTNALPFYYLFNEPKGLELLRRVGAPKQIVVNGLSKMGLTQEHLANDKSGGIQEIGIFFEGGVHCLSLIYCFVEYLNQLQLGWELGRPKVQPNSAYFARHSQLEYSMDTFGLISMQAGTVPIICQSGCGVAVDSCGAEITGISGDRLRFSVGTVSHPPYIHFLPKSLGSQEELIIFENGSAGYELCFYRLILQACKISGDGVFPKPEIGLAAGLFAIETCTEVMENVDWSAIPTHPLGAMPERSGPIWSPDLDGLIPPRGAPLYVA